ncbi:hypothetical protein BSKO_05803 [Bryopsis sp. KO-2023]|nr:hypothetical protein BSKO_05803 [Bryopsis sp. KO-2023]
MLNLLEAGGLIVVVLLSALMPAVSTPTCDFFKVEGGYLESAGASGGNLKCSPYPSVQAAKEECLSMVGCDGFSFGPWGKGQGGCLKENREGGFTASQKYVGYHKTLMGCCGNDKLERGQCVASESEGVEKLVSQHKPTMQSSTHTDSSRAVDGNKNPQWSGNSCAHTLETHNPWWTVDLLDRFDVTRVEITNRGDCCGSLLSNFVLTVGDNPFPGSNPACVIRGAVGQGKTKSFPCPLRGRFVTITIVKPKVYLMLCEVEVYAMVKMVNGGSNALQINTT